MTRSAASVRSAGEHRTAFAFFAPIAPVFNRVAVRIAGDPLLPFWGVVRHEGRKSGRIYSTPVVARRTADGFAIPLAFGEGADWCRNLLAKGRGVMRWSGAEYPVFDPKVVGREEALPLFNGFEQRGLRAAGIERVLLIRAGA
jgi:deazaflavin-dependent oxidoreductase (nitroreductase family)